MFEMHHELDVVFKITIKVTSPLSPSDIIYHPFLKDVYETVGPQIV